MYRLLSWYRKIIDLSLFPPFIVRLIEKVGVRWYLNMFSARSFRLQEYTISPLPGVSFKMMLDWQDYTDAGFIFFKTYEVGNIKFLSNILKPGSVFLDAGANIGYFSLIAAFLSPRNLVLSIEPLRRNRYSLKQNIDVNKLSNMILIPFALSDEEGEAILRYRHLNSGSPSIAGYFGSQEIIEEYMYEERVPTTTFMNIMKENNIDMFRCIKMDIQGAELSALYGARPMLSSKKVDYFIIEHTNVPGEETVRSFLAEFGYKPYSINATGALTAVPLDVPLKHKRDYVFTALEDSR